MNVRVWLVLLVVCGACRAVTFEDLGYPMIHKSSHVVGITGASSASYEQVVQEQHQR